MRSFIEMSNDATYDPAEVVEILQNNAEHGLGIAPHYVMKVVRNTDLSNQQLEACLRHVEAGREHHLKRSKSPTYLGPTRENELATADTYKKVADHIRERLGAV